MRFYSLGVNYIKSDVSIRSLFSLNGEQKEALLKAASEASISLMVISTCNRTEIYGFDRSPERMIDFLCTYSSGDRALFDKVGFVYSEEEAFRYVLRVASGLESQILGDFEIIGQFKRDAILAKNNDTLNAALERFINESIRLSKKVKSSTEFSDGSASVAYHAVRYIRDYVPEYETKSVLLFGLGEIGKNTCENLLKHTDTKSITLINRSLEKAEQMAFKYEFRYRPVEALREEIQESDVMVVSTHAEGYTVDVGVIPQGKEITIIDLTVPSNVDPAVGQLEGVSLINMDQLSQRIDETLNKRKEEIPKVENLVEEALADYSSWLQARQYVPAIESFKEVLEKIYTVEWEDDDPCDFACSVKSQVRDINDKIIQNITNRYASFIMKNEEEAEQCISMMSKVFKA